MFVISQSIMNPSEPDTLLKSLPPIRVWTEIPEGNQDVLVPDWVYSKGYIYL